MEFRLDLKHQNNLPRMGGFLRDPSASVVWDGFKLVMLAKSSKGAKINSLSLSSSSPTL